MKRTHVFTVAAVLCVLVLAGFGCTKKAVENTAENMAERALEQATNSDVDVDIATNSVTINTSEGSYQAGGNVQIPTGFPSDVYVIEGTVTSATTTESNKGYTLSIETNESVSDAKTEYEERLENDGWTVSLTMAYEDSAAVGAQKGDRSVNVSIGKDASNNKTIVVLTTASTEDTNSDS